MATIASIIKIPMKAEEKKPRRFLDCTISTIVRKTADTTVTYRLSPGYSSPPDRVTRTASELSYINFDSLLPG